MCPHLFEYGPHARGHERSRPNDNPSKRSQAVTCGTCHAMGGDVCILNSTSQRDVVEVTVVQRRGVSRCPHRSSRVGRVGCDAVRPC